MSDPVDDGLNWLEQHVPSGFIRDAVQTLREGWDFVVESFPDPGVLRTQGSNLSGLYDRGQKLFDQFSQSQVTLQSKWQGDLANTYLPTVVTTPYGYTPPDNSVSTQLIMNLGTFIDSLDHNSTTHNTWANQFDDVRGKQGEARGTITVAVVGAVAIAWIPGVDVVGDGADLTAAASITAGILNTVRQIWQDYKIVIIVLGVTGAAALTAIAVDELAKPAIVQTSATMPQTWTLPDGTALPKEFEDLAKKIFKQWANLVKAGLLTDAAIAYLACHYSYDFIQQLLNNFDFFVNVLGPTGLSSTALNDVNGAIPLLHAIQIIGIQNILPGGAIDYPYIWRDAQGNPELDPQGNVKTGDIDIITNYGRPWYIEVGTQNKISNADFPDQLLHLKREAERNGAWPRFYVQEPDVPMTPNQAASLQQTIETAVRVLDNGRPTVVTVNPVTGTVTVDPPSNSVYVMPPIGC